MGLPAPNLDDRTFQMLVDDAKRLVHKRCPDWTDHNVSDPGVTLIEACAQMVDQLIYRVNRVPDRHYVKFLELIGVELRPPSAARGEATFWLSAPQPQPVLIRAETAVATPRTDIHDAIVFCTTKDLSVVPCSFARAMSALVGGEPVDRTVTLDVGSGFSCFSASPVPGDALLIGLYNAVPSCAVVLRLDCRVAGVGVDPRNPPLVWEALTDTGWVGCDVDSDATGGLNQPGEVVLHVPSGHRNTVLARQRAGWLRCRLIAAEPEQSTYRESPQIKGVSAFTIGGTAPIVHAHVMHNEDLGLSDGTPAQRFSTQRRPIVPPESRLVLQVIDGDETTEWTQLPHFAESGQADPHFRVDYVDGEIQFGPAVRESDGALRQYGAVPPKGSLLRLSSYWSGGGTKGNVLRGQIVVLKSSVPYVSRVENRVPAVGGANAETLDDAKVRGPLLLRSRSRAVTAEDFEELAREIAPEIARTHCLSVGDGAAGGIRLLVVPRIGTDEVGRIRFEDLAPSPETLTRIRDYLDERRLVGTRLSVEPPSYQWLTVVVDLNAHPRYRSEDVRLEVLRCLNRLFDPLVGGPEGAGWPLGRAVQTHEVSAALARASGVDMAQDVSIALFPADPVTKRRAADVQRLPLPPNGLIYSFEHQVRVRE